MKATDKLYITILSVVLVIALLIGGKAAADLAVTYSPEKTETEKSYIEPHTLRFQNEICKSTVVQRTTKWLDLLHVCYNPEHGFHIQDASWMDEQMYEDLVEPLKKSVRQEAIDMGIYRVWHDEHERDYWGNP